MNYDPRRALFAACKKLNIDEDARHDLLQALTGKPSTKDLTARDWMRVMDHLNKLTGHTQQDGKPAQWRQGCEALGGKIAAQLATQKLPWRYLTHGANGKPSMAKRLAGVDRLEFADSQGLIAIITALARRGENTMPTPDAGKLPAPELLGTLRAELRRACADLLNGSDADQRERIVDELVMRAGCIAGHRLPTARGVQLPDLESASQHYMMLANAWGPVIAPAIRPAPLAPTIARLLDVAREVLGGEYIPRGKEALAARDAAMWHQFRGDITATALAHGISYQRARQILVRKMREERATRQAELAL